MEELLTSDQRPFVPFRSRWRTDDPAWLKHRKAEWPTIKANCAKYFAGKWTREQTAYFAQFYAYGRESAKKSFMGVIESVLLPPKFRMVFTPSSNAEEVRELFEAFARPSDKAEILGIQLDATCRILHGLPQQRLAVQQFVQGVLGTEYRKLEACDPTQIKYGKFKVITPDPANWAGSMITSAQLFIKGESYRAAYWYIVDCVPFFMSLLREVGRDSRELDKLDRCEHVQVGLDRILEWLSKDEYPGARSELRVEFVERLRAAFDSDEAPAFVRERIRQARAS